MKIRGAQYGARRRRFPQQQLVEALNDRREPLPQPDENALGGGILDVVVEMLMVERLDDALVRQRLVKEQFFGRQPMRIQVALDVIGSAAHQAVAQEMAAWR